MVIDAVVLVVSALLVVAGLVIGVATIPGAVLVAVGAGFAVTRVTKVIGRSGGRRRP